MSTTEQTLFGGEGRRAFGVTVRGMSADEGIYWTDSPARARYAAWLQFSDVFDVRDYSFREFVADARVRRRPHFDGAFTGRQGILPEFVSCATPEQEPLP